MMKLRPQDLWSLEEYALRRNEIRAEVMRHKQARQLLVDENARLCFEDRLTIHYQVQEMLRVERLFEAEEVAHELATYNPLIPDGHNWKATFMLEYPDPAIRREQLSKLVGIEHRIWVQVDGCPKVFAIADEDLERSDTDKTSAVHFLRFELQQPMIDGLKQGAELTLGIDHPAYPVSTKSITGELRNSLCNDLLPALH